MKNGNPSAGVQRLSLRWACLAAAVLPLACNPEPLPPETPQTEPTQPVPPAPVDVQTTAPEQQAPRPAAPQPIVVGGVGLETPECIIHVPELDIYLVSNINGAPTEVDNNGFISQIKPDGSVANLKFIAGGANEVTLHAPKGMAVVEGTLYVADLTEVRRFELSSGRPQGSIKIPNSSFLNDVAAGPDGALYVSDTGVKAGTNGFDPTGTDAVYKIVDDKVSAVIKGSELGGPNGVLIDGEDVLMVTFGRNLLSRIDASGKVSQQVQLPKGGLDGIVAGPQGKLLISSWDGEAIYAGDFESGFQAIFSGIPSPAAIGYDASRQRVLVPVFTANELRFLSLIHI